ncbi:hypothetical protein DRN39_02075 [Thermococci archaeon]|nr:MAG: hypothetical protein DRN39_02075 [Thermococci archaeon]
MVEEVIILADNQQYHKIIRSDYVDNVIRGIRTLGMEVVKFLVRAEERILSDGRRVLLIPTYLAVDDSKSYIIYDQEVVIESVVYKAIERVNEKFRDRNIIFYIPKGGLKIDFTTSAETTNEKSKILVDAPDGYTPELRRFGRGIVIFLKEKGIEVESFVISAQEFYTNFGQKKALKMDIALTLKRGDLKYPKEVMEEFLHEGIRKYEKFLFSTLGISKLKYGNIHIIIPGDIEAPSLVLNQKDKILEEVEAIMSNKDIQELVTILK